MHEIYSNKLIPLLNCSNTFLLYLIFLLYSFQNFVFIIYSVFTQYFQFYFSLNKINLDFRRITVLDLIFKRSKKICSFYIWEFEIIILQVCILTYSENGKQSGFISLEIIAKYLCRVLYRISSEICNKKSFAFKMMHMIATF